ncbi:MAG: helix-turn-helix transcriptional regulator [Myxococcota bacterium]
MNRWWDHAVARAIGSRIRSERRRAGLTQAQLAERIGTYRPIVARVEKGRHRQSLRTLRAYARALDVPVAYLAEPLDYLQRWAG